MGTNTLSIIQRQLISLRRRRGEAGDSTPPPPAVVASLVRTARYRFDSKPLPSACTTWRNYLPGGFPGLDASYCRCPSCRSPSCKGTWWVDEAAIEALKRRKNLDLISE